MDTCDIVEHIRTPGTLVNPSSLDDFERSYDTLQKCIHNHSLIDNFLTTELFEITTHNRRDTYVIRNCLTLIANKYYTNIDNYSLFQTHCASQLAANTPSFRTFLENLRELYVDEYCNQVPNIAFIYKSSSNNADYIKLLAEHMELAGVQCRIFNKSIYCHVCDEDMEYFKTCSKVFIFITPDLDFGRHLRTFIPGSDLLEVLLEETIRIDSQPLDINTVMLYGTRYNSPLSIDDTDHIELDTDYIVTFRNLFASGFHLSDKFFIPEFNNLLEEHEYTAY